MVSTQQDPRGPKLRNIQALRAVAALMVVFVHLAGPDGFERTYLEGPVRFDVLHLPGSAGVDLFFVISGVVMMITAWPSRGRARGALRFLRRRVARVVPMYWLVTAILVPAYLAPRAVANLDGGHAPDLLASVLLLPQEGYPLLLVGWSLVFEMWFYVLFALALTLGRRGLVYVMAPWVAVVLALHLTVGGASNPYVVFGANLMHLEFVMGIGVGYLILMGHLVRPRVTIAVGLLLGVAALTYGHMHAAEFPSSWYRTLGVGTAAAACIYGATVLELRRQNVLPRALQRLGDASYSLYLTHVLVLAIVGPAVAGIPSTSPLAHVLLLLVALAACIGTALVVHQLVERPLLRLLRTRRERDGASGQTVPVPAGAVASA